MDQIFNTHSKHTDPDKDLLELRDADRNIHKASSLTPSYNLLTISKYSRQIASSLLVDTEATAFFDASQ